MLKESAKISSLYSAPYMTIASDYLSRFEYPWEALSGIKDFIIRRKTYGLQKVQKCFPLRTSVLPVSSTKTQK